MDNILSLFTQDFFYATMRMASPIILIAIGEVVLQRSGIINLGMESMVIMGAFFGVLGSQITGHGWGGVGIAMLVGCLVGFLYGFFVISLRTNQSVTGIAFNVVGMGLTSFLYRVIWGIRMLPVQVDGIPKWPIPILSEIPYIGQIFFNHTPLVYLAYILVGVATFVLYKTNIGLRIRAIGEGPLGCGGDWHQCSPLAIYMRHHRRLPGCHGGNHPFTKPDEHVHRRYVRRPWLFCPGNRHPGSMESNRDCLRWNTLWSWRSTANAIAGIRSADCI